MKNEQQLERIHTEFAIMQKLQIKKTHNSPTFESVKNEDMNFKNQDRHINEEKSRLYKKKSQYAKYVNEVIRPNIKVKSIERIMKEADS